MANRKVIITCSDESKAYIAKELTALFPKLDKEPEYSLGFQRFNKLTKAQRNAMYILHDFDYNAVIADLENR